MTGNMEIVSILRAVLKNKDDIPCACNKNLFWTNPRIRFVQINAKTLPLFQQLKHLNVYDINNLILLYFCLCGKGLLQRAMSCKLKFNYEIHSHETRNAGNFHSPQIPYKLMF